jgi:formylglycine-generating enzyme required for sulfatase activity
VIALLLLACTPEPTVYPHVEHDEPDPDTGWNGPCPREMVRIGDGCVDAYEATVEDGVAVSRADAVPTIYITWEEARAACREAGKHLCTTTEWQAACAWGGGLYPWGDSPAPDDVCAIPDETGATRYDGLQPTGSLPECRNPNGVFDQVGNAWEWVDHDGGSYKVGGAWYAGQGNGVCAAEPVVHTTDGTIAARCCTEASE